MADYANAIRPTGWGNLRRQRLISVITTLTVEPSL